mgnify:CR=1 FL=1
MFKYQNYFIATDANHVTQHRRFVTPWFYVRLKSVNYIKIKDHPVIYDMLFFSMAGFFTGWCIHLGGNKVEHFVSDNEIKQKLETVTAPFSFDERMGK